MKPRLLAFCVTQTFGGGERYLLELLAALLEDYEVVLVTANTSVADNADSLGITVEDTVLTRKLGRRSALGLLWTWRRQRAEFDKILDKCKPDFMLLQYKLEQLLWAGRKLPFPVVLIEHGPIPRAVAFVPLTRTRYLRALREATVVFSVSSPAAYSLRQLGVESVSLPGGVRAKNVDKVRVEALRNDLLGMFKGATKIAIFAGRLEPNKGVMEAIDLISATRDYGLVIAGRGSLAAVCETVGQASDRVVFVSHLTDPMTYVAACDVGVLLTRDPGEGRPLFALECLSQGKPVVSSPNSSAMLALREEFGPDAVPMVGIDFKAGTLPQQSLSPRVFDWAVTASLFDETLRARTR